MRGDGFAPDGHDPEGIPQREQTFACFPMVPSAPHSARCPPYDAHSEHSLRSDGSVMEQPPYQPSEQGCVSEYQAAKA